MFELQISYLITKDFINFNIYIYIYIYMRVPKVGLTGFTYNWAHNLFVLWTLGFLLWVVLRLETPLLLFLQLPPSLSLSLKATPPFFGIVLLSVCSTQNCQPPSSQSILLYIAWGEWRCHDYSLTRVNGGPIPSFVSGRSIGRLVMALKLIPTSKRLLGYYILEGITRQLSTGCFWATLPPIGLKTIGRGLLLVSKIVQSHSSSWA